MAPECLIPRCKAVVVPAIYLTPNLRPRRPTICAGNCHENENKSFYRNLKLASFDRWLAPIMLGKAKGAANKSACLLSGELAAAVRSGAFSPWGGTDHRRGLAAITAVGTTSCPPPPPTENVFESLLKKTALSRFQRDGRLLATSRHDPWTCAILSSFLTCAGRRRLMKAVVFRNFL